METWYTVKNGRRDIRTMIGSYLSIEYDGVKYLGTFSDGRVDVRRIGLTRSQAFAVAAILAKHVGKPSVFRVKNQGGWVEMSSQSEAKLYEAASRAVR